MIGNHRSVPLPKSFRAIPTQGCCRWCGGIIMQLNGSINKRRRWHEGCLSEYLILTQPGFARHRVFVFERGVCQECGERTFNWELDHITPLWKVAHFSDKIRVKFFQIGNLQTLCVPCHNLKSGKEAGERAVWKREGGVCSDSPPPLDSLRIDQLCLHI